MLDGVPLRRCPRRPALEDGPFLDELFWLYSVYKQGTLPEGSSHGILGHPNKLVMLFRVIDKAIQDAADETARRERAKKSAKAKAAKIRK